MFTVIIMILSRYRYRPVTVPLQFLGLRYRTLPFLDQRYPRLSCVTDRDTSVTQRYRALQNVTSVTERYIRNLWIVENLNIKNY